MNPRFVLLTGMGVFFLSLVDTTAAPKSPADESTEYFNNPKLAQADKTYTQTLKSLQAMLRKMQTANNPAPFRKQILTDLLPAMESAVSQLRSIKPESGELWAIHTPLLESYELLDGSLWQWAEALTDVQGPRGKASGKKARDKLQQSIVIYTKAKNSLEVTVLSLKAMTTPPPPPSDEALKRFHQSKELKQLDAIQNSIVAMGSELTGKSAREGSKIMDGRLAKAVEALAILRKIQKNDALPANIRHNLLASFEDYESALRFWQRGVILNNQQYAKRGGDRFLAGKKTLASISQVIINKITQVPVRPPATPPGQPAIPTRPISPPVSPKGITIPKDPMEPVALINAASNTLELMRDNPAMAGDVYFSATAELAFNDIRNMTGKGLKYFAFGAVPMLLPMGPDSALIGLYHPWIDTMMITEWRREGNVALIVDVEIVTGGVLRDGGVPPFDVIPMWRKNKQSPLEAVHDQTLQTATAFNKIFAKARPGIWRYELKTLQSPEQLTINIMLVASRISGQMKHLSKIIDQPIGQALQSTMEQLSTGTASDVLSKVNQTQKDVTAELTRLPQRFWQQAQLMTTCHGSDGTLAMLTIPGAPDHFLSLLYLKRDGKPILSRVDVIKLTLSDNKNEESIR